MSGPLRHLGSAVSTGPDKSGFLDLAHFQLAREENLGHIAPSPDARSVACRKVSR